MLNIFSMVGVAFLVAGVLLIVTKVTGWNRPKWVLPIAIGGTMMAFPIWNEYDWFQRTRGELPTTVEILRTYDHDSMWQFWTWVFPRVDRFTAIDMHSVRRNEQLPGYAIAEVLFIKRLEPTLVVVNLFDCEGARRAEVLPNAEFGEDGLPKDLYWQDMETDDPMLTVACRRGK